MIAAVSMRGTGWTTGAHASLGLCEEQAVAHHQPVDDAQADRLVDAIVRGFSGRKR
jgi:hypothetical protein